jgi:hypothetical protein
MRGRAKMGVSPCGGGAAGTKWTGATAALNTIADEPPHPVAHGHDQHGQLPGPTVQFRWRIPWSGGGNADVRGHCGSSAPTQSEARSAFSLLERRRGYGCWR